MAAEAISRTDRLAKNTVFNLAAWFVPLLIGFFTTPILVRGLGNENYGLYAVILGFMSYSFSFGIGKIAAKYVAEYRASGETEKVNPVISATFAFSFSVAFLGTVLLASFARTIVTDVLLIEGSQIEIAVISLYLACAISFATMISQIYQNVLQGLHRFGTYLLVTNIYVLLLGVGNIAIVLGGSGVVAMLVWNTAVAIAIGVVFYLAARHCMPNLRLTFNVDRKTARAVLGYGTSIILYQVFANVLFIFERALLMRKFGAEGLAFYSVPMMLAGYLQLLVASFSVVLFPMVNELLNDRKRQIELYQKATKIIFAVVAFVVTTFICTGREGLKVWINQEFAEHSYSLLVVHSLTFGIIGIGVIAWQIAEGFGHARINAFVTAIWLAIAVPLMIFAADTYGPVGVAAARLAAVCITIPVILYCERRFLGTIFVRFWANALVRIIFAVTVTAAVEVLIVGNMPFGWFALASAGLCGSLAFGASLFVTGYFTHAELRLLTALVRNKLGFQGIN
jgi:O-antigen/teichoic acid export membrane protein